MMPDALAMLELDSVASGLITLDAMVKQAPVDILEANLVEPGVFLILYAGGVAEAEEAHAAGIRQASEALLAQMFIPFAHSSLLQGLRGQEIRMSADEYDCLGVVETVRVSGALIACDRALKEAAVDLTGIRLTGGLGGRGYFVVHGTQHDVEVALEISKRAAEPHQGCHRIERIARPHPDMSGWILRPWPFLLK
jgi:microcompartment protein CcmL/EutN